MTRGPLGGVPVRETSSVSFDLQPSLIGESVTLRPLRPEDHDALYAVARDPLIWEQHPNPDRHRPEVFDEFFDGAIRSGGALAILDRGGALIGTTRFHGHDTATSEIEIGWTFLARSHWGGITNREVKELMLAHAFESVDRVVFLIGPRNYRSQHAIEKLGARRVGERPDETGQLNVLYELRRPSP
jgi:RimJ/RimL family protein N-acetyltransferase